MLHVLVTIRTTLRHQLKYIREKACKERLFIRLFSSVDPIFQFPHTTVGCAPKVTIRLLDTLQLVQFRKILHSSLQSVVHKLTAEGPIECSVCTETTFLYKLKIQVAKSKHNYKSGEVFIKQKTCFGPCLLNEDSTTYIVLF